jgi:hypothetical protein
MKSAVRTLTPPGHAVGKGPAAQQIDAEVRAHTIATRAQVPEIAGALQRLLGRELTALTSGIQSARTVGLWARGESEPHAANEDRLRNTYRVVVLLRESGESERTIRAWFTGMNPHLDDRAPAQVIGENPAAVLAAAKDFLLSP